MYRQVFGMVSRDDSQAAVAAAATNLTRLLPIATSFYSKNELRNHPLVSHIKATLLDIYIYKYIYIYIETVSVYTYIYICIYIYIYTLEKPIRDLIALKMQHRIMQNVVCFQSICHLLCRPHAACCFGTLGRHVVSLMANHPQNLMLESDEQAL